MFRGQCGDDVVTDFVQEPDPQNRLNNTDSIVRATVPAYDNQNTYPKLGGMRVKVLALKPMSITGGGFEKFSIRLDSGLVPLESVGCTMHFVQKNGQDKYFYSDMSEFPEKPQMWKSGWRTISFASKDYNNLGADCLLKDLYFFVGSTADNLRTVKFGKVTVKHVGQDLNICDLRMQVAPICSLIP